MRCSQIFLRFFFYSFSNHLSEELNFYKIKYALNISFTKGYRTANYCADYDCSCVSLFVNKFVRHPRIPICPPNLKPGSVLCPIKTKALRIIDELNCNTFFLNKRNLNSEESRFTWTQTGSLRSERQPQTRRSGRESRRTGQVLSAAGRSGRGRKEDQ